MFCFEARRDSFWGCDLDFGLMGCTRPENKVGVYAPQGSPVSETRGLVRSSIAAAPRVQWKAVENSTGYT